MRHLLWLLTVSAPLLLSAGAPTSPEPSNAARPKFQSRPASPSSPASASPSQRRSEPSPSPPTNQPPTQQPQPPALASAADERPVLSIRTTPSGSSDAGKKPVGSSSSSSKSAGAGVDKSETPTASYAPIRSMTLSHPPNLQRAEPARFGTITLGERANSAGSSGSSTNSDPYSWRPTILNPPPRANPDASRTPGQRLGQTAPASPRLRTDSESSTESNTAAPGGAPALNRPPTAAEATRRAWGGLLQPRPPQDAPAHGEVRRLGTSEPPTRYGTGRETEAWWRPWAPHGTGEAQLTAMETEQRARAGTAVGASPTSPGSVSLGSRSWYTTDSGATSRRGSVSPASTDLSDGWVVDH